MYRVYHDLTNETLFTSEDDLDCLNYMADNYDVEHKEFWNIWMEEIANVE